MPLKRSRTFSCIQIFNIQSKSHQSYAIYQFTCAGCKTCCIGETKRHFNRTEEHLGKYEKSDIYSRLQENVQCQVKVNFDCIKIVLDCASSHLRLQMKEAMDINWRKSELNKQVKHVGITLFI